MKILAIKIGIGILNIVYIFIKLIPTQKNKVTFISRQSNEIPLDFKMIINHLNKNAKIVTLCKRLENGTIEKIKYCFHMLKQMHHIATSKVVILDSYCIPICILKQKKELTVIQIWHALGSLKKFGYSTLDKKDGRDSKIAKAMKMHNNYTYILTSSEVSKKFFMEAFNSKEEQMKVMNLPRVDFLQSEEEKIKTKEKFNKIYPEILTNSERKNILYCPTHRKNKNIPIENIVKQIPFENYNLIIKLHNGTEIVYANGEKIQKGKFFTGLELIHIADYVVTDYSAIVYEVAVAKKPIYFYAYDYDTYMDERGTYINYKDEMPGEICTNFKEIIELINKDAYNKEKQEAFCNKYIENLNKNATQEIVKLINLIL